MQDIVLENIISIVFSNDLIIWWNAFILSEVKNNPEESDLLTSESWDMFENQRLFSNDHSLKFWFIHELLWENLSIITNL